MGVLVDTAGTGATAVFKDGGSSGTLVATLPLTAIGSQPAPGLAFNTNLTVVTTGTIGSFRVVYF
jgi:hypothetical protein